MTQKFCSDDKYSEIILELLERGWEKIPLTTDSETFAKKKKMILPSECSLVWIPLVKVPFSGIFSRTVNHLKGSQHFSNKAYMSYHLRSTHKTFAPPTWSPVSNTMLDIIIMLGLNSLYALAKAAVLNDDAINESDMPFLQSLVGSINRCSASNLQFKYIKELLDLLVNRNVDRLRSCLLELEEIEPWRSYGGSRDVWIIKPVGGSCGGGITIVRGIVEAMRVAMSMQNFKCVVQKYIERPLLVRDGRKFDIRQWVLVTSVNPLLVYAFSEFYLRLSSTEYTLDDLSSNRIHLCNHSIQKLTLAAEAAGEGVCDTMMTQAEFLTLLEQRHVPCERIERLMSRVKEVCVETIISVADKLEKVGDGFEWLGFDLMVTEALEVLLIEVNVSPDITKSTPVTEKLVPAAVHDVFTLLLDERAASSLIARDAAVPRQETLHDRTFAEYINSPPMWILWHAGRKQTVAEINSAAFTKYDGGWHEDIEGDYSLKEYETCVAALDVITKRMNRQSPDEDPVDEEEEDEI